MLSALLLAALAASPTPAPSATPLAIVTLSAPSARLRVEVADTEETREYGLMNRTSLPAHTGMLFVFERDEPIDFWMKNTLVPLDMVFIDAKGVVRSVAANVPTVAPSTPDDKIPRRRGRARFVIELPANEAAADGLRPGVRISGLPPV